MKQQAYTELQQELNDVLQKLQAEDIDVNEAIELYEKGMSVTKQLETYLKAAENKIVKIKESFESK